MFPEFKPFFNNRFGNGALYVLKRYKTKERISKLTMSDFESTKKQMKGKFSYPKFSHLRQLAKDSIGITSKIYDMLIRAAISEYEHLSLLLESIDEQIIDLYQQVDSKLTTIPGMGVITAATIYAEIGDITKFPNPAKLIAFVGFDVSISQSGLAEHHGHIVKRGSGLLRKAIWTFALPSLRFLPVIHDYYHLKKSHGKHHKVALTHVCRKLIRMIYHIEYNHISYNPTLNH